MDLSLAKLKLKLNVPWKLSRNTSLEKNNFIITLNSNFQSEVAPNIRYQETPERIEKEFFEFKELLSTHDYEKALDKKSWAHSLRFALEACWLQEKAASEGKTLSSYLGISTPKTVSTSFSLPIMEIGNVKNYLAPLSRFQSLKIKLNAEIAWELVREVTRHTSVKLRLDGNEAWLDYDQYKKFEEKCQGLNVEFVEQPFPADLFDYYVELKKTTPFLIMADESIEDQQDFKKLARGFHAINVKLMKTGSILKAVHQLQTAKSLGLKTMIGCMIETSLGISYAMNLNSLADYIDLDGFLLIEQDPFGKVVESEGNLTLI
jgi:L-alanine-DL-glutamate epimerase-like enolase superfamily enzyme